MLNTTGLTAALTALLHGRSPLHPDQLLLEMDEDVAAAPASPPAEPPWEFSPSAQLLLPVAFFVVSVLAIDFSRLSQYIVTFWPTNAVILTAALRHERSLRNYGTILGSGACAIALAAIVTGVTPTSAIILGAADTTEVCIVLGILAAMRIDAANLVQFRNLMIFM